jgi:hypothetical protein
MALMMAGPRSLSEEYHSATANDLQASASFSARKNPQRIPTNTPPVFSGLRPYIYQQLLCLATKDYSDRLLALLHIDGDGMGGRDKVVVLVGSFHRNLV